MDINKSKRPPRTEKCIRLLGEKDDNGNLVKLDDLTPKNRGKLVEISAGMIADYLVMVYINDVSEKAKDEILSLIRDGFGLELRKSTDRLSREYWWRPVRNGKLYREDSRRNALAKANYYDRVKSEYPSLEFCDDAEFYIDLADQLGCDAESLWHNLD